MAKNIWSCYSICICRISGLNSDAAYHVDPIYVSSLRGHEWAWDYQPIGDIQIDGRFSGYISGDTKIESIVLHSLNNSFVFIRILKLFKKKISFLIILCTPNEGAYISNLKTRPRDIELKWIYQRPWLSCGFCISTYRQLREERKAVALDFSFDYSSLQGFLALNALGLTLLPAS